MAQNHDTNPELAQLRQQIAALEAENAHYRHMLGDLAHLRLAVAHAANPIIITDTNARILHVNRAFTEQTGYTADEMLGKNPRVLQSGTLSAEYYQAMWTALAAGRIWQGEFHNRRKDGTLYWEAAVIVPIRDMSGGIAYYVAIKEEITGTPHLLATVQRGEVHHRQIVELSPEAIIIHRAGKILYLNAAAAALLSAQQAAQLVGRPVMDLVPAHMHERMAPVVQGAQAAASEQQLLCLDGRTIEVSVWGAPVTFEGDAANLIIITDISPRKEAQRRLASEQRFSAALLDTVGAIVVVMDRSGRITRFNRAAEAITGYTEAEMLGTFVWDRLLLPEEAEGVKAVFKNINTTGLPSRYDNHWIAKDGSRRLIAWSNTVLHDEDGEVDYLIGTGLDITARMATERQLRERNQVLQRAQQIGNMGHWSWDLDTNTVTLSDTAAEIMGYVPQDGDSPLTIQTIIDHIHPDDRARYVALLERARATGESMPGEVRIVLPDGIVRDVLIIGETISDADGKPARRIGVVQDITAHKDAERSLKMHAATAQALINAPLDMVMVLDSDGVLLQCNDMLLTALETTREDLIGRSLWDVLPPDVAQARRKMLEQVVRTGQPLRAEDTMRPGRWYDTVAYPVPDESGTIVRVVVIVRDITARKQAEHALQVSEERLALALRGADHALWDWDLETGRVVRSDLWAAMLGYAPGDIEDMIDAWHRLSHPEDRDAALAAVEAHKRGDLPLYEAEYRLRASDGRWVWVQDRGRVVEWNDDGTPRRIVGMHHDITARKEAEQRLRQSEERHRAILQAIPDLIIRMNRDGLYLDVIPGEGVALLRPVEEQIGSRVSDVLPPQLAQQVLARVRRTLDTGEMQQSEYSLELEGETRYYVARSVVYGPDEVLTMIHDVTARKTDERRLLELAVERERVQVMTSFITEASHEFRTPLSVIGLNTYLLQKVTDRDKHMHYLSEISKQIEHLVKLVDALLIMARLDSEVAPQSRPIDPRQMVTWITSNYQEIAGLKGVEVICDCGEAVPMLHGDPELVMQALDNILDNAVRYTPEGGTVTVSARTSATHVIIAVTDSGPGLSAEAQRRVFERFYRGDAAHSTRGFGLGLPIAQAIVKLHGGRIEVESTPGAGCTFRILLPLLPESAAGQGQR